MSSWNLLENSKGELTVTVEGAKWAAAQKKAFNKIVKQLDIKGFRKGQVPAAMAKKYISEGAVLQEALTDDLLNGALSEGIEEHGLTLVDRPTLKEVTEMDKEKVTFVIECTVEPEVTLGDYKGLEVTKDAVIVEDAEVEAELNKLQARNANLELKEEGTVETGDTAVIDFEGFKDGVAFEGGKGENYPLEIGSGQFIPGFEEQVVGMAAEETKDITVTFPEGYTSEELAGAEVVFKVTVHEIKAKVLPEINDELIADADIEGVETVAQYKEYMVKQLTEAKEAQVENKFEAEVLAKVVENASVEIPEVMIENELNDMVNELNNTLMQQGLQLEQYCQIMQTTVEDTKEQMKPEATTRVNQRLVLEAIAKAEGIEVSEEEVNAEYEELAAAYGMEADKIKPMIPADMISANLKIRKAVTLIKESVK